jgi:hypothetical protein
MPPTYAKAYPHKRFFLQMFTRDITVESCLLDLIDNSIDALMRNRGWAPGDLEDIAFSGGAGGPRARVGLTITENLIKVEDTCGGIPLDEAAEEVFNFGHAVDHDGASEGKRSLGAYGIGMNRALFKIGKSFVVESQKEKKRFRISVDVDEWQDDEQDEPSLETWRFPMQSMASTVKLEGTTRVQMEPLTREAKLAASGDSLSDRLRATASRTYALFLNNAVELTVNKKPVEARRIPVGASDNITPATEELDIDGVRVRIYASLAARDEGGKWRDETAGWYVLCNGRVVVFADKTSRTGWGSGVFPLYQPQYRGFIGVVSFESEDTLKLPWTTTKRDVNLDSDIYRRARQRMKIVGKPVLTALRTLYKNQKVEETESSGAVSGELRQVDALRKLSPSKFEVRSTRPEPSDEVSIQFKRPRSLIERVKRELDRPSMSNKKVGERVFDYFVDAKGIS